MRRPRAASAPMKASRRSPPACAGRCIVVLILGAILLACGVALFVSAHWDEIGPGARLAVVLAMVSVFHLGGGWARERFRGLSTALHAVGTLSTGAAIALVGQIFNIEEHWPAAVLMWALAALAGWILLRDEAQQTLTLLLFPAWIALRVYLLRRRPHRRKRLCGPLPGRLGGSLPDLLSWLQAQDFAGHSLRRRGDCLYRGHLSFCWRAGVPGATRPSCRSDYAPGAGSTLPRFRCSSRSSNFARA